MAAKVLLLCSDFIFSTKIQATARQVGVSLRSLREGLVEAAKEASLVLVDLDAAALSPLEVIRSIRRSSPELAIVCFVRHDHVELIKAAREAGASRVLARNAFSERLPTLLSQSNGEESSP